MSEHHKNIAWTFSKVLNDELNGNRKNIIVLSHALRSIKYNELQRDSYAFAGEALLSMKKINEAEFFFKKTVDLSPYSSVALLKLAEIYDRQNYSETKNKQLKVLEFILSFDPKNVNALSYITKNLSKSGRGEDASVTYSQLKKSFEYFKDRPNFGPYHGNIGHVAISVGDFKYAKYVYHDAIKRFPTAENYYNLAILEINHLKNYNKGIFYVKKVLEINPNTQKKYELKKLINKYESSIKQ